MNSIELHATCDYVANRICTEHSTCDPVATSPAGPPNCPFERRTLLDELANKGIRLTSQRRVLVDIIQMADRHLDAASLLELARKKEPNIDRATVYRTIELLKKLRLIDELDLMHLQGEKHYYEVKTRHDHVHLACFQCGRIEEFSSVLYEQLKTEIASKAGFELRVARLEIGGRCRSCRDKAIESSPRELLAVSM
jgi:Fur family transcriptional regulator, ferric uptake regulator